MVELIVVKFPVIAVKVLINAVAKAKIFPEIFVTVVLPSVEEPVVKIFPKAPIPVTVVEPRLSEIAFPFCATKLESVVEASVDDPEIAAFVPINVVTNNVVDVLLVIVPFVALIFVKFKFPADKVVIVALVKVAFVPTMFVKFPVVPLKVIALEVVAFDVEE